MKKRLLKFLMICVIASSAAAAGYYINYLKVNIPAILYLDTYSDGSFNIKMPFLGTLKGDAVETSVNLMEPLYINAGEVSEYELEARLFGVFNIKNIKVSVNEPQSVVAGGNPVGIYIETDGVYVAQVDSVEGEYAPAKGILCEGDYITAVNGENVHTISELVEKISMYGDDYEVFSVRRAGENFDVKIKPEKSENGVYQIGIWVRDDYQGLGTLTFVTQERIFGTLGHSISDGNTGKLVELGNGSLYTAKIWSVIKGESGNPGEVIGSINYNASNYLGKITENTSIGVYGICNDQIEAFMEQVYTPVGYKQDIKKGKAFMRTYVDGKIDNYEIEIQEIDYADGSKNKGILFSVTDERVINATGGIIQGMSGSPIIQDGKLIGAVTHVLVNDPTRGYGIFIENMLEH